MAVMYCDRRGVIGFWRELARGCVPIAYGETRRLRGAAIAMARHGYDGKTLIVTGVPEAGTDNDEAVAAVKLFSAQMSELFGFDVPLIDGKRPTLPRAYRARLERHQRVMAKRRGTAVASAA